MRLRPSRRSRRGFTLLEAVIAMAILAMVLMAVFDLNASAIRMHVYTKHVSVASLLARSKMTDIENGIYEDGPAPDDEEEEGDFSDEGWANFKWRARILAPRTSGLTPEQLVTALFNIPMGGEEGGAGGLGALFGGAAGAGGPAPDMQAGLMGMLGPFASMAQGQFTQMVERIAQGVREVHLTVSWKEGETVESIDLVTHVVAFAPGADRNGAMMNGQLVASDTTSGGTGGWIDTLTNQQANCVPSPANPSLYVNPANNNAPCRQGGTGAGGQAASGGMPGQTTTPGNMFGGQQGPGKGLFGPGGLFQNRFKGMPGGKGSSRRRGETP